MKFLIISSCFFFSFGVNAITVTSEQGRVSMQGTIVDTACAIAVESRYQIIDMDIVPLADIRRNGQGKSKTFTIFLENCIAGRPEQEGLKHFQVIFDGNADGNLFGMNGEAKGVGLQITDSKGRIAFPGIPLPYVDLIKNNMRLDYNLKLVANNQPLRSGNYFLTIRFRLDYF